MHLHSTHTCHRSAILKELFNNNSEQPNDITKLTLLTLCKSIDANYQLKCLKVCYHIIQQISSDAKQDNTFLV